MRLLRWAAPRVSRIPSTAGASGRTPADAVAVAEPIWRWRWWLSAQPHPMSRLEAAEPSGQLPAAQRQTTLPAPWLWATSASEVACCGPQVRRRPTPLRRPPAAPHHHPLSYSHAPRRHVDVPKPTINPMEQLLAEETEHKLYPHIVKGTILPFTKRRLSYLNCIQNVEREFPTTCIFFFVRNTAYQLVNFSQ